MIFVVKLFNEFWNHDKIRYLYEAMENHWNVFTSEIEIRILKDYSMLTRKCIITYSIITYVSTVLFLMVPFKPILLDIIRPLNESRPRIFVISEIEWGMDKDKYFVLIFCYTSSVIVMGATIFVAVDSIYITRTVHACSLFSIISQQLEKVTSKLGIDKLSEQVTYQEYVICLKKYQLALE
ncbi:uncharacterized protein LOC112462997 [Temnothorax curvispinosus]|uniref:Uncharacterized protein LOC112462997 n=1 Tax=Temnothorax curvispinosus TaxID=300111 RepID=A0A6J1QW68_9HYME|nr:uncharacterized protein LOC112462997 [Temnothorax curvispinosus]